jgi:hypothetical protein
MAKIFKIPTFKDSRGDLTVIEKSEYDMNACIIKDYADLINEL